MSLDDAVALLAKMNEQTTRLQVAAADVDDDELSRTVETIRRAIARAGNRAVALRRAGR